MTLLGGTFAMLSNVTSSLATAASGLAKSAAKCVPKFDFEGYGGKTVLIGSTAITAGMGGYLLWQRALKPHAVPAWERWRSGCIVLYDPEYVLPCNAKWAEVVEEEERRNPNFGKDVYIDPLYRIDSDSNAIASDSLDNVFMDADEELDEEEGVKRY